MQGNQYWERPKDLLVHGPLQALQVAVINVSILELYNVAIEGRGTKAHIAEITRPSLFSFATIEIRPWQWISQSRRG